MTIQEINEKYKDKIDHLDLELLISNSLGKTREFVLTYPEHKIPSYKIKNLKFKIARRMRGEPIAYILGHKEFYGLDFIVNKHTLVPRPETEMMVDLAMQEVSSVIGHQSSKVFIADIGTGSGNIIISIAKSLSIMSNPIGHPVQCKNPDSRFRGNDKIKYFSIDISKEALKVAKKNAKVHGVDKQIKFLQGNLLLPIIGNCKFKIENSTIIIVANLPYLSSEIYNSAPVDVKYEPKSALYSDEQGLKHYRELLEQIKELKSEHQSSITALLEISPEQKIPIKKIIENILPASKIEFKKDLAGKWRLCSVNL